MLLSIRTPIVVALSCHSTSCALENSLDSELATTSWLVTTPWFIGWSDLISVLSLDNFEGYLPMLPVSNGESGQVGSMSRTDTVHCSLCGNGQRAGSFLGHTCLLILRCGDS